jgi:hypothetical protein
MAYKFEKIFNEQSGQLQRIDGTRFDLSQYLQIKKDYDTKIGIDGGFVFQSFWRGSVPSGTSFFFHQNFEFDNITYQGILFKQIVTGGPFTFKIFVNATPGSTLETRQGYNLDRRRQATGNKWTSTNPILRVSSLTNGTQIDEWFENAGSSGSKVTTSPIEELGVIGIYDSTASRSYEVINSDNSLREIVLVWTWKEIPKKENF